MKYFLSMLILLFVFSANSQNRSSNIWCFGDNAKLDFNSGAPVSDSGCAMATTEGCASIADMNTGNLLFYSDGTSVWDSTNTIMPSDSIPLGGNASSTQSALIVPYPGSSTKYYLFTVDWEAGLLDEEYGTEGDSGVHYCIIDMSLNGGLGDVAQQPQPLVTPTCEKITATLMANNQGYWMVTHLWNSDAFYAYPVTVSGIGAPVISDIGKVVYNYGSNEGVEAIGYLKISPDGSKIAIADDYSIHTVQVFNFNNITGTISDEILSDSTLLYHDGFYGLNSGPYGLSFSPNSQLLYMTIDQGSKIHQYNLAAGNPGAVLASRVEVGAGSSPWALQLGPDQKIYVCEAEGPLDRIDSPNVYGTGCNFHAGVVPINYGFAVLGLPDYIENLSGLTYCSLTYPNCSGDTTITFADTALTATCKWNFGDTASSILNISTSDTGVHTFLSSGTYSVSLTLYSGSDSTIITKNVAVYNSPPQLQVGAGVNFCTGDSAQLSASSSDSLHYTWSPAAGLSCVSCPNPFASPDSTTEYYVQGTDAFGCIVYDSVKATLSTTFGPVNITSNKTIICPEDSAQICVSGTYASYLWNTGSPAQCIYAQGAGDYYATVTNAGNCMGLSNHIPISVYQPQQVEISANGDTLFSYDAVTYQWYVDGDSIPGATKSDYTASESGSYTVAITDTNGCIENSSPYQLVLTGINRLSGDEWLKVYPNPSTGGNWQLSVSQDLIGSMVEIYDDNGRLVYKSEVRNPVSNLALEVARGVYTLRLTSGSTNYNLKLITLQ